MIRPALPEEAALISALAIRSKAYWGYSPDEMQVFREELTLQPRDVEERSAHVLEEQRAIVGFYTLLPRSRAVVELEHLFVEPRQLRRGHGTALFDHAVGLARARGHERMVIQSDPGAEGFYQSLGVPLVSRVPSSIPGRTIPCFELEL